MKLDFSRQIFEKKKNYKYHISRKSCRWESSSCTRADRQTDRQTDMMKPIVAFRNFSNASKNELIVHYTKRSVYIDWVIAFN